MRFNNSGMVNNHRVDDAEIIRRNLNVSRLDNTFSNFKETEGNKEALTVFKKYAVGELGTPLLICVGGYGCGKTHLLEALVLKRREMGYFARVIKFHQFLDALKNSMRQGAVPTYDQILENYLNSRILCLDDIGMGNKETPWVISVLEALVDHRYHERLETVMTTNMDIKELPPRVFSRLNDHSVSTIVLNKGGDYRLRK